MSKPTAASLLAKPPPGLTAKALARRRRLEPSTPAEIRKAKADAVAKAELAARTADAEKRKAERPSYSVIGKTGVEINDMLLFRYAQRKFEFKKEVIELMRAKPTLRQVLDTIEDNATRRQGFDSVIKNIQATRIPDLVFEDDLNGNGVMASPNPTVSPSMSASMSATMSPSGVETGQSPMSPASLTLTAASKLAQESGDDGDSAGNVEGAAVADQSGDDVAINRNTKDNSEGHDSVPVAEDGGKGDAVDVATGPATEATEQGPPAAVGDDADTETASATHPAMSNEKKTREPPDAEVATAGSLSLPAPTDGGEPADIPLVVPDSPPQADLAWRFAAREQGASDEEVTLELDKRHNQRVAAREKERLRALRAERKALLEAHAEKQMEQRMQESVVMQKTLPKLRANKVINGILFTCLKEITAKRLNVTHGPIVSTPIPPPVVRERKPLGWEKVESDRKFAEEMEAASKSRSTGRTIIATAYVDPDGQAAQEVKNKASIAKVVANMKVYTPPVLDPLRVDEVKRAWVLMRAAMAPGTRLSMSPQCIARVAQYCQVTADAVDNIELVTEYARKSLNNKDSHRAALSLIVQIGLTGFEWDSIGQKLCSASDWAVLDHYARALEDKESIKMFAKICIQHQQTRRLFHIGKKFQLDSDFPEIDLLRQRIVVKKHVTQGNVYKAIALVEDQPSLQQYLVRLLLRKKRFNLVAQLRARYHLELDVRKDTLLVADGVPYYSVPLQTELYKQNQLREMTQQGHWYDAISFAQSDTFLMEVLLDLMERQGKGALHAQLKAVHNEKLRLQLQPDEGNVDDDDNEGQWDNLTLSIESKLVTVIENMDGLRRASTILGRNLLHAAAASKKRTAQPIVAGISVEWTPSQGDTVHPPALLTIATRSHAFLFDLPAVCRLPPDISDLGRAFNTLMSAVLSSTVLVKIGFRLLGSFRRLLTTFPKFVCWGKLVNLVELERLGPVMLSHPKMIGIAELSKATLGRRINRGLSLLDWQSRPFEQERVDYAALQGHALTLIFDQLTNGGRIRRWMRFIAGVDEVNPVPEFVFTENDGVEDEIIAKRGKGGSSAAFPRERCEIHRPCVQRQLFCQALGSLVSQLDKRAKSRAAAKREQNSKDDVKRRETQALLLELKETRVLFERKRAREQEDEDRRVHIFDEATTSDANMEKLRREQFSARLKKIGDDENKVRKSFDTMSLRFSQLAPGTPVPKDLPKSKEEFQQARKEEAARRTTFQAFLKQISSEEMARRGKSDKAEEQRLASEKKRRDARAIAWEREGTQESDREKLWLANIKQKQDTLERGFRERDEAAMAVKWVTSGHELVRIMDVGNITDADALDTVPAWATAADDLVAQWVNLLPASVDTVLAADTSLPEKPAPAPPPPKDVQPSPPVGAASRLKGTPGGALSKLGKGWSSFKTKVQAQGAADVAEKLKAAESRGPPTIVPAPHIRAVDDADEWTAVILGNLRVSGAPRVTGLNLVWHLPSIDAVTMGPLVAEHLHYLRELCNEVGVDLRETIIWMQTKMMEVKDATRRNVGLCAVHVNERPPPQFDSDVAVLMDSPSDLNHEFVGLRIPETEFIMLRAMARLTSISHKAGVEDDSEWKIFDEWFILNDQVDPICYDLKPISEVLIDYHYDGPDVVRQESRVSDHLRWRQVNTTIQKLVRNATGLSTIVAHESLLPLVVMDTGLMDKVSTSCCGGEISHRFQFVENSRGIDLFGSFGERLSASIAQAVVLAAIAVRKGHRDDLYWEASASMRLVAQLSSRPLVAREQVTTGVRGYLMKPSGKIAPMVVYTAREGGGATTAMAHIAAIVGALNPRPILMVRFVGKTVDSMTERLLVCSLIHQVGVAYGKTDKAPDPSHNYWELCGKLKRRLMLPSAAKPLVLIIDGLEQGVNDDLGEANGKWIPTTLSQHVRIIVSTTKDSAAYRELASVLPTAQFISTPPIPATPARDVLAAWGAEVATPTKPDRIVNSYNERLTLVYLRGAFEEQSMWRMKSDVSPLPPTEDDLFFAVFERFETALGKKLVSRALALLTAAVRGLSLIELSDMLSADSEIVAETQATVGVSTERRVPVTRLEVLRHGLSGSLMSLHHKDASTLTWANNWARKAARRRFLSKPKDTMRAYHSLAAYFGDALAAPAGCKWTPRPQGWHLRRGRLNTRRAVELLPALVGSKQWDMLISTMSDIVVFRNLSPHSTRVSLLQAWRAAQRARDDDSLMVTHYNIVIQRWGQGKGQAVEDLEGVITDFAEWFEWSNELPAARALRHRVLGIRKRALGMEHPNLWPQLHALATVHLLIGDVLPAEECLKRAMNIAFDKKLALTRSILTLDKTAKREQIQLRGLVASLHAIRTQLEGMVRASEIAVDPKTALPSSANVPAPSIEGGAGGAGGGSGKAQWLP